MIWDEFIARHSYKTYPSQWYLAHALGSVIGCYRYTESTCQTQKVGWQIPSQNIVGVAQASKHWNSDFDLGPAYVGCHISPKPEKQEHVTFKQLDSVWNYFFIK